MTRYLLEPPLHKGGRAAGLRAKVGMAPAECDRIWPCRKIPAGQNAMAAGAVAASPR